MPVVVVSLPNLTTSVPTNETQGSSSLATHILVGDMTRVKILERGAAQIYLSDQALFGSDQTYLRASLRTTVAVDQPAGLSVAAGIV